MFEGVVDLAAELVELEHKMSDPKLHSDQNKARQVGRRFAELKPIVATWREYQQLVEDHAAAVELSMDDSSFKVEAEKIAEEVQVLADKLQLMLIPRDPLDGKDVIVEVKSGEGGEESALFAGDLVRMYLRFAEKRGWKATLIDAVDSDMGGYKKASIAIKAKANPELGNAPYAWMKHEGGVHRVQRVPVTESQGRVHTSAAGVLVFPEAEEIDVEIKNEEIRVDVYRSSGPGGQSVNTTDSAVRITHIATGIVVSCQNERSQIQNRATAMAVLQSKLLERRRQEEQAKINALKGDNSGSWGNQMRSYVLAPYQMVKDLRTDHETGNTGAVLDGEIDDFIEAGIRWRRSS